MSDIAGFASITPSTENYFRSVVLFGRNVASYKFALAKSLIELASADRDVVPLTDLAVPFARELCSHLRHAPTQATSASSRFLDTCRQFNDGVLDQDELVDATSRRGFVNVIDAFHIVGPGEIPVRFFTDERRARTPSIAITNAMRDLVTDSGADIGAETDARWRLVETAWELGTTRATIEFDNSTGLLIAPTRRRSITGARGALNGYQKGRCFYCYRPIGIAKGIADLADVDHVFPHVLQRLGVLANLDGVWNAALTIVGFVTTLIGFFKNKDRFGEVDPNAPKQ